jgi:beta-N-acetylhexosaminidase
MSKKIVGLIFIVSCLFIALLAFIILNSANLDESGKTNISSIVANMTLDEKIAQKIMPAFRTWNESNESYGRNVTLITPELEVYLKKYKFGGVDLYGMNTASIENTTRLCYDFQKISIDSSGIPMLICTDQEGGSVARIGGGTMTVGNMALGATQSYEYGKQTGLIIGEELKSLGINTDFAPVVDVNTNPNNPIIGRRSFSSNTEIVSKMGEAFALGLHSGGVLSTGKHFPGHGDTGVDSHSGLPVINKTLEELYQTELVPFKYSLNNLDCMMTAHIALPKVDNLTGGINNITLPATLSYKVLTEILRNQMGYQGVIITDAMEMKAIQDNFNESDSLIRAFAAGNDMVLQPFAVYSLADESKAQRMIDDVKVAIQTHQYNLTEEKIDESVKRILKSKQKQGIMNLSQYQQPVEEKVKNAKSVVGSVEHHEIERKIADDSITIIKNYENQLPWNKIQNDKKTLFLAQSESSKDAFAFGINRLKSDNILPQNYTYDIDYYSQYENSSHNEPSYFDFWKDKLNDYDKILVITSIGSASKNNINAYETYIPKMIVKVANEQNKEVVLSSAGLPYDVANYKSDAKVITICYGSRGHDVTDPSSSSLSYGPNIPALLDIVFGYHDPTGHLPVDTYKIEKNGNYDLSEIIYPFNWRVFPPRNTDSIIIPLKNTFR